MSEKTPTPQSKFRWMGIILVFALAVLLLIVSVPKLQFWTTSPRRVGTLTLDSSHYDIPLETGVGRVTVIPGDNSFQFIVDVYGLWPREYEIALRDDQHDGITLGLGNAHTHFGEFRSETAISPTQGRILVWSVQPKRIFANLVNPRIVIKDTTGRVIAKTFPISPDKSDRK